MTCGKKPVPFEEYIRQGFTSLRQCLLMSKWGEGCSLLYVLMVKISQFTQRCYFLQNKLISTFEV